MTVNYNNVVIFCFIYCVVMRGWLLRCRAMMRDDNKIKEDDNLYSLLAVSK
jgi:hypothetical protein